MQSSGIELKFKAVTQNFPQKKKKKKKKRYESTVDP